MAAAAAAAAAGTFVDTHAHLDLITERLSKEARNPRKDSSVPPAIAHAKDRHDIYRIYKSSLPPAERYEAAITVGCSLDTLDRVEEFLRHDEVYGAFGIHPLNAEDWSADTEAKVRGIFERNPGKAVAWGECGLDYHYCDEEGLKARQRDVFTRQLRISAELGLPLVVHTREAEEDTLALMKEHLPADHKVHVHCFTSSLGMARRLLGLFPSNLCIGFTGVITFKNAAEIREVVAEVPLSKILLETDGPYMAPTPYRGQVAHPGHVYYVASKVAEVKGTSLDEVLATCRDNTRRTYGI